VCSKHGIREEFSLLLKGDICRTQDSYLFLQCYQPHLAHIPLLQEFVMRSANKKKAPSLTGHRKKLGSDLLSHTLVCSTIGDEGLNF
jgi:hypothetical protein